LKNGGGVSKTSSIPTLKTALTRERRKNRRLRAVIDDLLEQCRLNRRDLDLQFTRLAQLQAELDALKGGTKP
jgi:uncharacterized protein YigA (DUF484 family)